MLSWAGVLRGKSGSRGLAPKEVDPLGNRLQVERIYTCMDAAQVVENKWMWDNAIEFFVENFMRKSVPARVVNSHSSISVAWVLGTVTVTSPNPARPQFRACVRDRSIDVNAEHHPFGDSHEASVISNKPAVRHTTHYTVR